MNTKHNNAFDYVRHLAAALVLVSHHFALYGGDEPLFFGYTKVGTACVIAFFAISGYLITASYCSSTSLLSYARKRVFRIFPALIVCSILMTMVACTFFGLSSPSDYWSTIYPLRNILKFSLLDASGSGEFTNYFAAKYRFPDGLNGSLWTLFYEVFDYVVIAFTFLIFSKAKLLGAASLLIGSIFLQLLISKFNINQSLIDRSTILTIPFAIGSIFYLIKHRLESNRSKIFLLAVSAAAIILLTKHGDERDLIFYMSLPVLILAACTLVKNKLPRFKFDYSYGIYIYAYPIQQLVINELGYGFLTSILISFILTVLLASLSWHFVESKVLKFKKRESTLV